MATREPIHLTDHEFDAEVLDSEIPVLVDYWAEWCGPCKMIAPILDEVSKTYDGRLQIAKMNVDEVFRLKGLYNVKITTIGDILTGSYAGDELLPNTAKIQWTTEDYIPLKILVPGLIFKGDLYNPESLTEMQGYAENAVSDLPTGEIVQFERVGFVRLEKHKKDIVGVFTHK